MLVHLHLRSLKSIFGGDGDDGSGGGGGGDGGACSGHSAWYKVVVTSSFSFSFSFFSFCSASSLSLLTYTPVMLPCSNYHQNRFIYLHIPHIHLP